MKTKRIAILAVIFGMALSVSAQEVVESKYGADSANCVTKLSVYREYYKQWEAAKFAPESVNGEMITAWREVFLTCPRASQYTYTNGEKILDYLIRQNPKDKDAYIDTLGMLMDNRALYFPTDPKTGASQVANIKGRKGMLIYTYNKNRYEEAYNVLKEAVALDPSQLQGAYIDAYFKATIDMVNNGKEEKMTIINVYQELSEVLDDNIKVLAENEAQLLEAKANAEESGDAEAVAGFDKQIEKNEKSININKGVKNNVDNLFQPYASCDDLIKVFTAKMAETPDDIVLLKRITTILDKKDCTDSKLFLDASKKLYELEPSPEAAYNIGVKLFKDGKNGEAAKYFEQATSASNNDRVYRAYRNLAYCYLNMGANGKCRDAARRAAAVDPTAGEPYILIGMAYAASASSFADSPFKGKEVYWAAVDKFARAASIDSSVASRANGLAASYRQHFPTAEDIFFNDYAEGQSYTVGGWIGETTTIRAAK
jgi:tetratricopeptide (TPR) repeat protein